MRYSTVKPYNSSFCSCT